MAVIPLWTVNPHEPVPADLVRQQAAAATSRRGRITPMTFSPASHVVPLGGTLSHKFCVSATRERFEKYTGGRIVGADGSVTPWDTLRLYTSAPSSNCKAIDYPVPTDAPEGEAAFTLSYEWQDRETGEYDDATVKQRFWIGSNPVPKLTWGSGTVGWGGSVSATVEYLAPGSSVSLSLEIAGKFINTVAAAADDNWLAYPLVKALNRWTALIDYEGSGTATARIAGGDFIYRDLIIRKAFWWATEQPYEGASVNYVETYKGYTIWYLTGPGGIYAAKDPYGNEMPSGSSTLSGMRTLIDNWLGATYTLTVTSNLDTQITVGEKNIQTNTSLTLLNGCYQITCPALLMVGGAPWVVDYMQNLQTDVKFYGENSIVQCLQVGPETTHIEFKPAEEDTLLEVYRGVEIWYDWRPAYPPGTYFYAKVGPHGKWFDVTEHTIQDVRAWIDSQLIMETEFTAQPTSGPTPLTVTFTNGVSLGLPPYNWTLDPGDGSTPYSGSRDSPGTWTQAHTYIKAGTFTATLTVEDSQGITAVRRITASPGSVPPLEPSDIIGAAATLIAGAVLIKGTRKG